MAVLFWFLMTAGSRSAMLDRCKTQAVTGRSSAISIDLHACVCCRLLALMNFPRLLVEVGVTSD
jgi:hypothetical protein